MSQRRIRPARAKVIVATRTPGADQFRAHYAETAGDWLLGWTYHLRRRFGCITYDGRAPEQLHDSREAALAELTTLADPRNGGTR